MPIYGDVARTIDLLNDLNALDPKWLVQLCKFAPKCSQDLADHPEVQCRKVGDNCSASVLGLLNGLHGTYDDGPRAGWGPITAIWADDNKTIIRFEVTQND